MEQKMKHTILTIMSIMLLMLVIPLGANAKEIGTKVRQGYCGTDVLYVVYDTDADGEGDYVVISGTGEIRESFK